MHTQVDLKLETSHVRHSAAARVKAFPANVQTFTAALCTITVDCWRATLHMLEAEASLFQKRCVPSTVTFNAAMDVCGSAAFVRSFSMEDGWRSYREIRIVGPRWKGRTVAFNSCTAPSNGIEDFAT